jgi:hypothetical protein
MRVRFTIRDLLWLAALVALAAGWSLDHWRHTPSFRERQLKSQVNSVVLIAYILKQLASG